MPGTNSTHSLQAPLFMENILIALSWGFGILTALTGLFNLLSSRTEADDPEFQRRFDRAYEGRAGSEAGARMAGAFFAANDQQPLRLRWKFFWGFLAITGLSLGGLQFI